MLDEYPLIISQASGSFFNADCSHLEKMSPESAAGLIRSRWKTIFSATGAGIGNAEKSEFSVVVEIANKNL